MDILDEQLRLINDLMGVVFVDARGRSFVPLEQIAGEFAFSEAIVNQFGVIEARTEFIDDGVVVVADIEMLRAHQRARRHDHRLVGLLVRQLVVAIVQRQQRFELGRFGFGDFHRKERNHLAGAFAHADVINRIDARIAPVAEVARVFLKAGQLHVGLQHGFDFLATQIFDPGLEVLVRAAFGDIALGQRFQNIGHAFGWHRADRQAVAAGVLLPLSAEHDLEVRQFVIAGAAAVAEEADVGHVMLPAGVKAATDLDFEFAHGIGQQVDLFDQARPQLGGQAARRGDAELAGVGAGASRDIDDGAGVWIAQADFAEIVINRWQIGVSHPAQDDILLNRETYVVADIAAGDIGELEALQGGEIAERRVQRDGAVTALNLAVDVGAIPVLEAIRQRRAIQRHARLGRLIGEVAQSGDVGIVAVIPRHRFEFFFNFAPEFFDAELGDQELDASAVAILLLAQTGEDARDRLRQRQQLFFGAEFRQHFRLMRHGAQPAADKNGEAAHGLAIDLARLRQQAQVVHLDQAASVTGAAGEGHLELAAEVLHIVVVEQKLRHGVGIGADIKDFIVANAGQRASGDIAHRVATGFLRGDADSRQPPHQIGRVVDMHVVELDILARGDVQDAV